MNTADLKILVVEDDEFQRQMLQNMLHSIGVNSISPAAHGKEALSMISEAGTHAYDIALCDLNMPEMDGMEFLRHLGQQHSEIAVIITSSLNSKVLVSVGGMTKLYGIKLLGALEKPIMPASLRTLLSDYNRPEKLILPSQPAHDFSLGEILQGIHDDQFVPYFQPKVDLKTGCLVGAEALARWLHPAHGVIAPHAFIPLLEQSGRIDDLTFPMLRKSVAECHAAHDSGHMLTVSVNLSLSSLEDHGLADRITREVRGAGIEPRYVVLEITESAAMTNVCHALENLARLCMNGFSLSIDDYGTGYSNLQQLTRIAFSELKIDQSFVRDFGENEAARIIVESSIDMARKLRVKSVAEGVETQQDWDTMKSAGCDTVQGYFIARPMEAKAFSEFTREFNKKPVVSLWQPIHR